MALLRVRKSAQLTLPAEIRRALKVDEGDYLEAELVKGGVLLKPVSVVARRKQREQAWRRIQKITSRVVDLKPDPNEDPLQREQEIAEEVMRYRRARRRRRRHA